MMLIKTQAWKTKITSNHIKKPSGCYNKLARELTFIRLMLLSQCSFEGSRRRQSISSSVGAWDESSNCEL